MQDNHQQKSSKSRSHRFTFQSTVRQIERRRIADRLSKEAEQKEAERISELEAMRRVEEEFQRKRAREKASIRHQLRIYSMVGEDAPQLSNNNVSSDWQSSSVRIFTLIFFWLYRHWPIPAANSHHFKLLPNRSLAATELLDIDLE